MLRGDGGVGKDFFVCQGKGGLYQRSSRRFRQRLAGWKSLIDCQQKKTACHLAAGNPAHAVGDQIRMSRRIRGAYILILGTLQTSIGFAAGMDVESVVHRLVGLLLQIAPRRW
jgi:hypothetical protein